MNLLNEQGAGCVTERKRNKSGGVITELLLCGLGVASTALKSVPASCVCKTLELCAVYSVENGNSAIGVKTFLLSGSPSHWAL